MKMASLFIKLAILQDATDYVITAVDTCFISLTAIINCV